MHRRAVVLGEQKSCILPDVCVTDFLPQLVSTIHFQNLDGFRRQTDRPGLTGFGWSDISVLFLCVQKRLPDHHNALIQINAVPLQAHQLSTATTGVDENVGHGFPLDRSLFQRFDNVGNLLRLEVVCLVFGHFGRRGFRGGIIRDKHFLICLRQNHGDQTMMLQNGFVGQRFLPIRRGKQFGYGIPQCLCNSFGGFQFHCIPVQNCVQCGMGNAGFFCDNMLWLTQCFHFFLQHLLRHSDGSQIPYTILGHCFVKIIQVLWANLCQLQVSDGIVDSREHIPVSLNCGWCKAVALLQIQHIVCIIAEAFDLVDIITCLDGFLEFEGRGHRLPLHLLFTHVGTGWFPYDPLANLLPLPIQAAGNIQSVVQQLAIFAIPWFNICHAKNSFLRYWLTAIINCEPACDKCAAYCSQLTHRRKPSQGIR